MSQKMQQMSPATDIGKNGVFFCNSTAPLSSGNLLSLPYNLNKENRNEENLLFIIDPVGFACDDEG